MFEFEFFAGIGGGVGISLIVWWVVDRQRSQNRPNDEAVSATRADSHGRYNEGNATKLALRQGEEQ